MPIFIGFIPIFKNKTTMLEMKAFIHYHTFKPNDALVFLANNTEKINLIRQERFSENQAKLKKKIIYNSKD
jgi:hypothetical protein